MLKKSAIRRIMIASLSLVIVVIIYLFPTKNNNSVEINGSQNYTINEGDIIYLLDNNDYVARTNIVILSKDTISKCKEIIDTLTINSSKKDIIPNGFKAIIPKNTSLKEISLKDGLLKLNFSKEFLNVNEKDEEKMLESLIYSLTNLSDITSLMIFVEGELLTTLKNGDILPIPLTRQFGINKIYDFSKIKGTNKVTIYYISKYDNNYYYVPITKISNNPGDKMEIIIKELKSSPIIETNLMSYLTSSVELLNYELLEEKINLSFNKYLLDDFNNKNILEEVKYTISLSVMDNFNVEEINFYIENKKNLNVLTKNLE